MILTIAVMTCLNQLQQLSFVTTFRLHYELQLLVSSIDFKLPEFSLCNSSTDKRSPRFSFGNATAYAEMDSTKYLMTRVSKITNYVWLKVMLKCMETLKHEEHLDPNDIPFNGPSHSEDLQTTNHETDLDDSFSSDLFFHSPQNQEEDTEDIDVVPWDAVKLIFLALDVVILVFRLSHLCLNVRKMCNGFQETVALKLADTECTHLAPASGPGRTDFPPLLTEFWQNHCDRAQKFGSKSIHETSELNSCAESLKASSATSGTTSLSNHHYMPNNTLTPKKTNHSKVGNSLPSVKRKQNFVFFKKPLLQSSVMNRKVQKTCCYKDFLKQVWHGLSRSEAVPSLILMVVILLIISLGLRLSHELLQSSFLLNFNGFFTTMQTLTVHTNTTNDFLGTMGEIYTADFSHHYTNHMVHELSNLQGIAELHLTGNTTDKVFFSILIETGICCFIWGAKFLQGYRLAVSLM